MELSRIDVSLQYGKFLNKKVIIFFYFCCFTLILMFLFVTVLGIIFIATEFEEIDQEFVKVSIAFISIVTLCIGVCIYLIVRNNRLEKKINMWLENAVERTAYSKTIDSFRVFGQPFPEMMIEVSFVYDGKHYSRISGEGKKRLKGFHKYADREISILYSPKYDQVLILKDEK